jgi:transcriptional regulator with XRE-family HTH domain
MKQRRQEIGLSQRELGIAAGFDEGVASTRINRYEVGVHSPDPLSASRIAAALGVPLAALYCEDDNLLTAIELFWLANPVVRAEALRVLSDAANMNEPARRPDRG